MIIIVDFYVLNYQIPFYICNNKKELQLKLRSIVSIHVIHQQINSIKFQTNAQLTRFLVLCEVVGGRGGLDIKTA